MKQKNRIRIHFSSGSVKQRLMLSSSIILCVGFCLAFALVALLVQKQYQEEFTKRLDASLAIMETQGNKIWTNPQKYAREESDRLSAVGQQIRITVLDSKGNVLGDSEQPGDVDDDTVRGNHLDRPEIVQADKSGRGYDVRLSENAGERFYYAAVRLPDQGYLRAALSIADLDRVTRKFWIGSLLSLLLGLILVCTVTWFMADRFTLPIRSLTKVARRISEGDLSGRMQGQYTGEIGDLTHSFNIMAESTEQAVLQTQKKQEQLEGVLQGMDDGVLCVDRNNRIVFLNQRARELLNARDLKEGGILDGSLLIRQLADRMRSAGEQGEEEAARRETLTTGGPKEQQYNVYIAPIPGKREDGEVLAVIADVTRMRRLEQLRSEFVANVTHELKTPLTSIRGSIELLRSGDRDEETRQYFYDVLDIEAERLHHLIDDMLVLSQIENAKEDPSARRCNLKEELMATIERLHPVAEKASVTLELDADPSLYCDCSPTRIGQLFINLIENAIKYNVPQGKVTVTARRQRHMAIVRVRDTGIGIAPEHLDRLFERFYRVDTSRSREIGGTGLGLSIVKHLAALYHGEVSVESEVGKGSTFTVRLPLSPE